MRGRAAGLGLLCSRRYARRRSVGTPPPGLSTRSLPAISIRGLPRYDIELRVDPDAHRSRASPASVLESQWPADERSLRPALSQPAAASGNMRLTGVSTLPDRFAAGMPLLWNNTDRPHHPDRTAAAGRDHWHRIAIVQHDRIVSGYVLFGASEGILYCRTAIPFWLLKQAIRPVPGGWMCLRLMAISPSPTRPSLPSRRQCQAVSLWSLPASK